MFDIFSTREIAVFIWFCLVAVYCLISKKMRSSVISLVKCALNKNIVLPFIFLSLYSSLITFLISKAVALKAIFIKDIAIWTIFVGIPICFSAVNNVEKERNFFRDIVADNLKLTAVVQFFTGAFTLHIIAELFMQPILFFLTITECYAEKNKNHELQRFCQVLMAVIGFIAIGLSLKMAIESFSLKNSIDLLIEFLIPIIFSVAFIPTSFFLTLFAKYQLLFCRLSFKEPAKNKKKYRLKIIKACNFRMSRIMLFQKNYMSKIYRTITDDEYYNLIEDFTKEVKGK